MKVTVSLILLIVFAPMAIGLFIGLVLNFINRKTDRIELIYIEQYGKRINCVDCKYCKKSLYRPFYSEKYKNYFAQYVPRYCYYIKQQLPSDINITCLVKEPEYAIRENRILDPRVYRKYR